MSGLDTIFGTRYTVCLNAIWHTLVAQRWFNAAGFPGPSSIERTGKKGAQQFSKPKNGDDHQGPLVLNPPPGDVDSTASVEAIEEDNL